MQLKNILASATIAGIAVLGLAAPAFASATPGPVAPTSQPTNTPGPHDGGWNGGDHKGGGDNCHTGRDFQQNDHGNCGGGCNLGRDTFQRNDGHGDCGQGCNEGRDQWGQNQWNRDGHGNCDPRGGHGDGCNTRTLLPSQCGNGCDFRTLTSWTQDRQANPWQCGDHNGRGHHRTHCTAQLVLFNFPHNSHILTETFGPALHIGEVATYQGLPYTVTSTFGSHFTVSDWNHSLVTNHGPSIWRGEARVTVCTCNNR